MSKQVCKRYVQFPVRVIEWLIHMSRSFGMVHGVGFLDSGSGKQYAVALCSEGPKENTPLMLQPPLPCSLLDYSPKTRVWPVLLPVPFVCDLVKWAPPGCIPLICKMDSVTAMSLLRALGHLSREEGWRRPWEIVVSLDDVRDPRKEAKDQNWAGQHPL